MKGKSRSQDPGDFHPILSPEKVSGLNAPQSVILIGGVLYGEVAPVNKFATAKMGCISNEGLLVRSLLKVSRVLSSGTRTGQRPFLFSKPRYRTEKT